MSSWEQHRLERDAAIIEALADTGGLMTVPALTRKILGLTANEKPPRSWVARVTQSLRVMEREGIVTRYRHGGNRTDWGLTRSGHGVMR